VHGYFFGFSPGPGSRRSLAARGQFLNTFAGLAFSVAFLLLALGSYLIEQQLENPVEAQSIVLLFAALLIATAITLLYCLLHPSRKSRRRVAAWPGAACWEPRTIVVARCNTGTRIEDRNDLPLHGRYVDSTRIRIQRQPGFTREELPGSSAPPESAGDAARARPQ
jgi:hypothetical protein